MQSMRIAVAASFTAEPLADSLHFWSEKLHWHADISFAPYNQIFQQLLDPASLLSTNQHGMNLVLVRPEDWVRYEEQRKTRSVSDSQDKIEQSARELVEALRSAAQRSSVAYIVCLCPASPDKVNDPFLQRTENSIYAQLSSVPGIHLLKSTEVLGADKVGSYYDQDRDEMGHIPYTPEFFAALGTVLARKIGALQRTPYKVIVVDCDETLWTGVCGEVGASGIAIDVGRRHLQEFLVRQHDEGMLLCLCSKNNQEDVDEVFRCRSEMPLTREHIVAQRVNWDPKPENLRALASELHLGLDSFIFLDDNPLECEQVKANCPEVLTLQLPATSEKIPQFLENVWAFDKQKITDEDRKRASLYRENRERDRFRQEAPTLEGFFAGLRLKIDINPLTSEQVPRVSQLTQRTNQFNCTTLRRTEQQIRQAWSAGELECLTVSVSDRFGDYGLTGATMFRVGSDALLVDTFLLSCRVLGRGVEHSMLRRLGEVAKSRGLARVDLQFIASKKNTPALSFLEMVAGQFKEDVEGGSWFRVPSDYAAELSEARILATSQTAADAVRNQEKAGIKPTFTEAPSEVMQEIATVLTDVPAIVSAIREQKRVSEHARVVEAPRDSDSLHQAVVEAWAEVLGTSEINPQDDFFALGGDSLLATQVISRLRQVCGVRLHLRDIFDHPTVSGLAERIRTADQKSRTQAAEAPTAHVLKSHQSTTSIQKSDSIPKRRQQNTCALSFTQQRWWFLNQWAPGTADHLSLVLRLQGDLDKNSLERALTAVTERHEVLRTNYVLLEGSPVQVIAPPAPVTLSNIDLRHVGEQEREKETDRVVAQEFRRTFDLSHDPILRPTLLEFSSDCHVLVLVMHHIASDGWARGILLRELEAFYNAYSGQKEPALPELPVQYADYALWQRERMAKGELDEQLSFWKKQLADAPSILELPTDRPRPSVQDLREGVHIRVLSRGLLERLHKLSQQQGTTLFMTLLAAYEVLLHRYSGQEDVVIGSPVAGRNNPSIEGLIGCFINMVVFRNQVSGKQSFSELLSKVREVALAAQDNQDAPFERLVEELEHGRDMSRAPIFQVVFALENLLSKPHFRGLEVDVREEETRTAFHDVSLFVAERCDGLRVRFEYRTDLFDAATIERMAGHFENLLTAITADPGQQIASLPMLSEAEHNQLLYGWNQSREFPVNVCIHQLFEAQVRRVPQNVALVFEHQSMSYAELNARSNQLARYLSRMGVGPDVLVGLCVERSLDMVVGILGIVKAGGAYLPLDPRYPTDRLAFMVEDAKPPVVLTQYELKESLPDIDGQVIALDADWAEIEREEESDLACAAQPENLAYVIYTSGSTGRPKGCQITHGNVVRLFDATAEWYGFNERDVWTMFHSYAFDFSVWELWGALIYGGRVVVVPYLVSRSPEEFYQLLETEQVTVLNQTPSSFRQLMHAEELMGRGKLSLRYVIFGGEALEMQSLRPWFERHGDQTPQLVNMYGITETTVHVTYRPLSMADTASGSVIGCPIPDLQVYLLDPTLEPSPIGVPGEMYIGGAGVARGYLNRPELNAERFVPDRFHSNSDQRLYRSGDLARRLPNGDIEYLGRIDQQVKIRGFRIELGEIESVLGKHPGVRESVVLIRDDEGGEKRLLAYVVPHTGQTLSSNELHTFLKDRLPEYMVPAAFVKLERMPLTSNGKIDRRALPEAEIALAEAEGTYVAPRTPLEDEVIAAWKEVLGLERIGVHDNFFQIGGHSLLATRVIILLRSKLGLNFSLRLLFENPTVEGMASALIETLLEHGDETELADLVSEVEGLSDEAARQMRNGIAQRDPLILQSKALTDAGD
jgi:amino acid adenylation domain-containing protein/FkbH-like protein